MKYLKTILHTVIAGGLAVSSLSATAAETELRLAHNLSNDHVLAKTFEYFAQQVDELSDGEMEIKIYPNGQMGETKDIMAMMQQGAVDMTKAYYGELQAFEPSYFIFSVPYLFQDDAHLERTITGEVFDQLNTVSRKKGFFNLAAYGTGTRNFTTNKPIRTLEDLKGLKIRVLPTPTTNRAMELMGASPVPVPFGETYTALQQGVVDGAENNMTTYVSSRHFEVSKYFTRDQHSVVVDFLTMSTKSWDRLTEEQQDILLKAARTSQEKEKEIYTQDVKTATQTMLAAGNRDHRG